MTNPDPQPEQLETPPAPLSTRLNALGAWPPGYEGRPGQRPPRRFSALTAVQAIWPGFIQQFKGTVPEEFWTWEDGVAVIACPCGAEPKIAQNGTAICDGKCGRAFMLVGETIKVATYSPEDLFTAEELGDDSASKG